MCFRIHKQNKLNITQTTRAFFALALYFKDTGLGFYQNMYQLIRKERPWDRNYCCFGWQEGY